jgi:hypothetical protein
MRAAHEALLRRSDRQRAVQFLSQTWGDGVIVMAQATILDFYSAA